jgi:hypothetical protein
MAAMTAPMSPPIPAEGVLAYTLDGCYPHRTARDTQRGSPDHARAEELNNLKLALATFALQLDVFEMRMSGTAPGGPAARSREGEKGWPSIKSPGNKSAA